MLARMNYHHTMPWTDQYLTHRHFSCSSVTEDVYCLRNDDRQQGRGRHLHGPHHPHGGARNNTKGAAEIMKEWYDHVHSDQRQNFDNNGDHGEQIWLRVKKLIGRYY